MALDSLPARPLTTAEGFALHQSDRFRMVTPASVSTENGSDDKLVSALVLVRDGRVFGVGYSVEDGGWERVYHETFEDPEVAMDLAEEANEALQEWIGHRETEWQDVPEAEGVRAEAGESEYAARLFEQYRKAADDE
ncbi:hypothetical protein [Halospeciosus flavus]|uniref:DUF7964 domain-containing protein n=1 Tax=Halospeciosus flavus TaxID=3032283 RepID=A0ABD5Z3J8_9EURY|nr:hypothetical protein [Halospeciosus flavus]